MLNMPRIVEFAVEGQFERMLSEVIRNGPRLPLSVRLRLSEGSTLALAATGLALSRVVALTFRPTPISITLMKLLLRQAGPREEIGPAAAAIAAAALLAFDDQIAALPGGRYGPGSRVPTELVDEIREAASALLHRLFLAQQSNDLARDLEHPRFAGATQDGDAEPRAEGLIGDAVDSAIVLWQLGLDPRLGRAVRLEALMSAVETHGLAHDRSVGSLIERSVAPTRVGLAHSVSLNGNAADAA